MRPLILFLVFFIAGCGDHALPPIKIQREKSKEFTILTRAGSAMRSLEDTQGAGGFDTDLVDLFTRELGIKSRTVVAASDTDILRRLLNGEGHLAAAWQTPSDYPGIRSSAPYFQSTNVLVTHEASLPLTGIEQLAHRMVHVVAGSRQEAALYEIKKKFPDLIIASIRKGTELDLMEGVSKRRFEAALVSNAEFDVGSNFYPELQNTLQVGEAQPIVWLFSPDTDPELIAKANDFLTRLQSSGEMDRLKDRYFGHVDRLTPIDSVRFIESTRSVLPQYRALFQAAQLRTGIDWRQLAALAYQESQWKPLATSPTGVRGMMMLTEDTADTLGVSNRLDPGQSISAGAEYLSDLRDALPASVSEPDRLWFALAAYNLGMGHLNAARHIAKTLKANPDSWYEMKKVLPLLAQARYYSRLKSGKGRGGEAVIMVENIRVYTDILNRYEPPFRPMDSMPKMTAGSSRSPSSNISSPSLPAFTP